VSFPPAYRLVGLLGVLANVGVAFLVGAVLYVLVTDADGTAT